MVRQALPKRNGAIWKHAVKTQDKPLVSETPKAYFEILTTHPWGMSESGNARRHRRNQR